MIGSARSEGRTTAAPMASGACRRASARRALSRMRLASADDRSGEAVSLEQVEYAPQVGIFVDEVEVVSGYDHYRRKRVVLYPALVEAAQLQEVAIVDVGLVAATPLADVSLECRQRCP